MRSLITRGLTLCAAAFAVLGVGTSYADSVAMTRAATHVTQTSAELNGSADPTNADANACFGYGTTKSYGRVSQCMPVGPGLTQVLVPITGLTPGTTYHFALAVEQGSYQPMFSFGNDVTFTTLPANTPGGNNPGGNKPGSGKTHKFGRGKLAHRRLKVKGGFVSIPFTCVGAKGLPCKGKVSLSATKQSGKTRHTITCGTGKFVMSVGHGKTVRAKLTSTCLALLKASHKHSISATLKATFSTHQGTLKQGVTLFE